MDKKVVIIHGNSGATGNDQWIPWLKSELEKQGIEVLNPTMPDNHEAKMNIWLPYMQDELKIDEQTIIVGWSSGAVAAMRYAENHKILGSVLIWVCHTDLGDDLEELSGYYRDPWNWDTIRKNQKHIVQFGSIDDPVIPVAESRFVHEHLNTEYYEYPNRKHFGWPDSMPVFPELLEAVMKF